MGANHPGEIGYLSQIARPDVAVITNAGAAHLEGFGDIEGVASAKGEILSGLDPRGVAVLNADDDYFPLWRRVITSYSIHYTKLYEALKSLTIKPLANFPLKPQLKKTASF